MIKMSAWKGGTVSSCQLQLDFHKAIIMRPCTNLTRVRLSGVKTVEPVPTRTLVPEVWWQGLRSDTRLTGRLGSKLLSDQEAVQTIEDAG